MTCLACGCPIEEHPEKKSEYYTLPSDFENLETCNGKKGNRQCRKTQEELNR